MAFTLKTSFFTRRPQVLQKQGLGLLNLSKEVAVPDDNLDISFLEI